MRQEWLVLLGFVSVCGIVTPARAQERPNGFFLTSPLGISSGYDDNFVSGSRVLDGNVNILTSPTMAWFKSTHRTMFSVDYEGEFEMFPRDEGLDAWNHAADLHFRQQLTPRMSL